MANPNTFVENTRSLANELGALFDRMEALLSMSASLGGDTEDVGWLQQLSSEGVLTGTLNEALTKERLLDLLGTFTTFQNILNQGHRTNLNRWRW